jgi:CRISPR-associated protein Cpf1
MTVQLNNTRKGELVNVNAKLVELFDKYNFNFRDGNCLKESICSVKDAKFFEVLLKCLSALLSLRHTWKGSNGNEYDTIVSSVELIENSNKFYSSESEKAKGKNESGLWNTGLPVDADANGAYNIARKGLWLLRKLDEKNEKEEAITVLNDLKWCPNREWLNFVQEWNV